MSNQPNYLKNDSYKKAVRRALLTENFKPSTLYGLQIEGFKSAAVSPVSTLKNYERGINSSSLAAVFPFVRTCVLDDGGILLGENKNNGYPFILNLWKRGNLYQNSNAMIIGKSGSGKSYFLKTLMMAYYIFNKLTLNKERMIDSVYSKYKKINPSGEKDDATIIRQLESSIQRENSKLENLTAMRMEGELSKEEYLEYKNKLLTNITRLQQEIDSVRSQSICRDQVVCRGLSKQEMQELLKSELDFSKPNIKEGLIDTIVSKVLAHSALEFDWYLNLFPHADESEYNEVATFIISYEEAHSYREMRNEMLRRNQYQELTVRIFV